MRDFRRLQNTAKAPHLRSKTGFGRFVKEVVDDLVQQHDAHSSLRFKPAALECLHHAAEAFLVYLLSEGYVL